MPRYVYLCPYCKEMFDVDKPLSMSESPVSCPRCGSYEAKKVYFPPAISVKGLPKDRFKR
jgi:putative FmdB family regulatory protein